MNFTLQEAAQELKVRPAQVPLRRLGEAEGIGYFKVNGDVRIPAAELADWEERNTVKAKLER